MELSAVVESTPAGGSPLGQVMIASAATTVVLFVLVLVGLRRRAGAALRPLDMLEAFAVRVTGLPGWSALPVGVATGALVTAVFGLYWDVSLHMDKGRDPGPLANPSHFFILGGLLGIFAAGWLATVMARETPGPAAVRITEGWYAPVGGLVMMACSSFAAVGFPLDDMWHRLFGQDVTLWGPTHMMMLTGAALTLVGIMVLLAEGRRAGGAGPRRSLMGSPRLQLTLAAGGLLVGLSIYQGEFDYGAPQFRLLYQPALIALAASCALVVARQLGGAGAALGAAVFFVVLRGALTIIVGPGVFGETVAHFPLYMAEAAVVEGVALGLGTARQYRFALVSGALIGTVGMVAEYAWTHVWMPLPWPSHVLPGAIAVGVPVALAGALVGTFLASSVQLRPASVLPAAAGVVAVAIVFAALNPTVQPAARASVTLTDATPSPHRTVNATLRLDPPSIADRPDWLVSIAWQGKEKVETHPLVRVREGVYRTSVPVPADGTWKSAFRLARGDVMASVPLYMPGDSAIPAKELPAPAHFDRAFVSDHVVLQRERKDGASGGLWHAANIAVLSSIVALLALLGWALRRVSVLAGPGRDERRARTGVAVAS